MTHQADHTTRMRSDSDPIRKVGEDWKQLEDKAAQTMHELRDQAGAAVEHVKAETTEIAASAGERVRSIVEEQKGVGAEALGAMARAAQQAAGSLETQTPMVARAVRQAAEGAERMSRDLRERSVGDLVNTVSDFARREPVAFFAGTVLAGLVLARFVKSSATSNGTSGTAHHDGAAPYSEAHQDGGTAPTRFGHDREPMAQPGVHPVARGVA